MATFPTTGSRYTPPLDPQRILLAEELSEIAERAQTFTSASGAMIAMKRGNELVVRTSHDIAPEVGACIPLPSGVTGLCVTTKKPQSSASADAEAQLENAFRGLGLRSVLSVPVQWDGEVRGVLAVLSLMPEAFNRTHIAILMTLRDVIASKLSQCELPSEPPRPEDSGHVVELDANALLNAAAPAPTVVTPKPAAPAPPKASAAPARPAAPVAPPRVEAKASALPAQPASPAAPARVEPAAPAPARTAPAASAEAKPPATPVPAKPLQELMKQPAEPPVKISPDVLAPSEDPAKFAAVQKPKPVAAIPVVRVTSPVVTAAAPAAASSPAMFTVYRTPAKSHGKNVLVLAGSAAAVVVLGLAITLYPSHKPSAAAPAASTALHETAAPAAAPSLTVVPLPKSAGEQPPAAAPSKPAPPAAVAKHEQAKPAAEPKPVVEEAQQPPVPVLHVASAKTRTKSEETVEPPALGLIASSGSPMPALPSASLAAPSLAARKSALVPATLVQGGAPQYPQAAKRLGLSGTVKLQVSISAEGKVTDIRVLSGNPLFRQPSIVAVRNWIYRPAHLDGKAVASTGEVSLQFNPGK